MSQKKLGRPTDKPKTHSVRIRMDEETVSKLDVIRAKENLNRSEMIRKSIHKYHDDQKN